MDIKYPIVMLLKKNSFPYIYTFDEKNRMHQSSLEIVNSGRTIGMKIIDSGGCIYTVKKVHIIKYLGFWGFTLRYKGRSVYIDYEYEEETDFISLNDFKDDIINRIHKTSNFWKESYSSIKELTDLVSQAESYEKVMILIH